MACRRDARNGQCVACGWPPGLWITGSRSWPADPLADSAGGPQTGGHLGGSTEPSECMGAGARLVKGRRRSREAQTSEQHPDADCEEADGSRPMSPGDSAVKPGSGVSVGTGRLSDLLVGTVDSLLNEFHLENLIPRNIRMMSIRRLVNVNPSLRRHVHITLSGRKSQARLGPLTLHRLALAPGRRSRAQSRGVAHRFAGSNHEYPGIPEVESRPAEWYPGPHEHCLW